MDSVDSLDYVHGLSGYKFSVYFVLTDTQTPDGNDEHGSSVGSVSAFFASGHEIHPHFQHVLLWRMLFVILALNGH